MAYRDSGAAQANSAPLPRSLQIGWAFGTAGSTTILYIINIMFLYFMVAHLGIAPAVAGSLLLFARIYDAVADLFIGTLSDRTRSRWGRRRPWMAVGTAMATLGMAMTFMPQIVPDWIGPQGQITIILVLLFTGYSAYSIPASAMATEMTTDYQGRTTLMAYRTFFIQVSTLVAVAGAPAMVAMGGGTTQAYLKMGIVMAIFIAISMGTAVAMTAGAPDTQRTQREMPGWERITSMFANRPFLVLLAIKFCGYISTAAAGAAGLFFMRDVIQRGEAGMSAMGLFSAIAGMATVPLWRWIARFGRKEYVCIAAMVCTLLVNLSWLAASPQESDAIFYLRGVFTGLSATGALMMMLAMLPDAIEHDFYRTGLRREGVYAAIFEFFQKAAFAIGPFFVGLFLTASGYKASTGAMFSQGAEAIHAVRLTMSVLPAACTAISIFLLLFCYRLPPRQA